MYIVFFIYFCELLLLLTSEFKSSTIYFIISFTALYAIGINVRGFVLFFQILSLISLFSCFLANEFISVPDIVINAYILFKLSGIVSTYFVKSTNTFSNWVSRQELKYNKSFDSNFYFIIIFIFIFSFVAYLLETAVMGVPPPSLPYKLVGIINYLFLYLCPMLWLVVFFKYLPYINFKDKFYVILIYLFWIVLTMIATNSRGSFITHIVNLIVVIYGLKIVNMKFSWIFVLGLFLLSLVPGLTRLRETKVGAGDISVIAFTETYNNYDAIFDFYIHIISNRIFTMYSSFLDYWSATHTFNDVLTYSSFSKYRTFVLDDFSAYAIHSSGSNTLGEMYIVFGKYWFLIAFFISSSLLFIFMDIMKKTNFRVAYFVTLITISSFWSLGGGLLNFILFSPGHVLMLVTSVYIAEFLLRYRISFK